MVAQYSLSVQRPTPLHKLHRLSARLGADVWVKRDDLTGFGLSGNKVRKLEMLLPPALCDGVDTVITTGGVQSNHCRATVVAARQMGLNPVVLLRGEPDSSPDGNLLLNHLLGAEIHYCTAETYRHRRDVEMRKLAQAHEEAGRKTLVIPEGGSNGLGAKAFWLAANEVVEQQETPFDHTLVAVGSGGTLAGLSFSRQLGFIHGVAVCDDRQTFRARVQQIAQDTHGLQLPVHPNPGTTWDILEGYQGPGYGLATKAIWETIIWIAEHEGILLDPVYTGKAMHALICEAQEGRLRGRILFWHTGGAFGLFGRGQELLESRESYRCHFQSSVKEES